MQYAEAIERKAIPSNYLNPLWMVSGIQWEKKTTLNLLIYTSLIIQAAGHVFTARN